MNELYEDNDDFMCHRFSSREEWLKKRKHGIGGSDASVFVGRNNYKDNVTLWKEKQGLIEPQEIDNEATRYGKEAETYIRGLFTLKHPEYDVQYIDNCILQSKNFPFVYYSPDGLLLNKETQERGIWECKTSLIQNMSMYNKWKNSVPIEYYIQTLHGLLANDYEFVHFYAELRFAWDRNTELVEHVFTKAEAKNDLAWLLENELKQWLFYKNKEQPPLIVNL